MSYVGAWETGGTRNDDGCDCATWASVTGSSSRNLCGGMVGRRALCSSSPDMRRNSPMTPRRASCAKCRGTSSALASHTPLGFRKLLTESFRRPRIVWMCIYPRSLKIHLFLLFLGERAVVFLPLDSLAKRWERESLMSSLPSSTTTYTHYWNGQQPHKEILTHLSWELCGLMLFHHALSDAQTSRSWRSKLVLLRRIRITKRYKLFSGLPLHAH